MGWNQTFRAIVRPLFEAIRPIPPIAWIPLITMWFGIYELPKIIIIFLGTFTPIVVNTYTGVAMVPELNMLAAEMISAKSGLGFLVIRGQDVSDYPLILLSMVFIGVIGALISFIFQRIERWLCPWNET